jgi:two-component system LytT family response regulator
VFLTAYDEHALRAFDAEALDYLLKPIDDERFGKALARARARIAERDAANTAAVGTPRIAVRDRGRVVLLEAREIAWVTAAGDYVRLHVGSTRYLLRETLGGIEARLPPAQFVRVHRSCIVNLAFVRELLPRRNREQVVVMREGTRLRLSRSYRDRVARLMTEAR